MGLFSRSSKEPVAWGDSQETSPEVDWSDIESVKAEWTSLESPEEALLGWRNGMRMFEEDSWPNQRMNVAEYMTRALAYDLGESPLLDEEAALETVRRVLIACDRIPRDFGLVESAPRLARLALTVAKIHQWQPASLGGSGLVDAEITGADRDWIVWRAVAIPGVPADESMRRFFD